MSKLTLKDGHGTGVFATESILNGKKIIQFKGQLFNMADIPNEKITNPEDDRFIQIGPHTLMGPSGDMDDYFNHSCNPNAGIRKFSDEWWLIAIRDIKENEEITWDYSTTMHNDAWKMICECGESICRKTIQEYKYLPKEFKDRYEHLGIVPDYNLK